MTSEPRYPHGWGYGPSYSESPPAPPPPRAGSRFTDQLRDAPVTLGIVIVTIGVWLVHLALSTWWHVNTDLSLGDNGAGIHGQPWRLLTAMVVHFGILHIGLNMFVLVQIGPPVEKVLGRSLYLASYVVCGIGGSILSDVALGSGALSGGASGAIVGIVGVLIGNVVGIHLAEQGGRQSVQQWRFNPSVAKSLAIQIVAWIAISAIAIPQIDNWAHVGGGVTGLAIGAGVAWSRLQR